VASPALLIPLTAIDLAKSGATRFQELKQSLAPSAYSYSRIAQDDDAVEPGQAPITPDTPWKSVMSGIRRGVTRWRQ
jgi:hypothetical protein